MSVPMTDLLTRLESGSGSDRELDALIWARFDKRTVREHGNMVLARNSRPPHDECVLGYIDPGKRSHNFSAAQDFPRYTSSLDAALSLVERMLPGWDWYVRHATSADGDVKYGNAQIWRPCDPRDDEAPRFWANHDQPVRALLIALLRALDQEPQT